MKSILSGIRILDLSTIVAGPTASMILADLGADVIKVEPLGRGDDARAMGPHRGEWGAYFTVLNRGKRSIALDLSKPAGRDAVLRIAATCDVFVENLRGGKAAALGLDESAVRAQRTDIVYASLSAYGTRGPDRMRPGYDAVVQARTGIVSVTGTSEETAVRCGVSVLDMGAGMWLAMGILAALFERQRAGRGQRVDSSLFQTGVMFMGYHLLYRQFAGVNPKPQGARHTAFAPYGAYGCADGTIMIGISGDKAFRRLCEALAHPEWAGDARFRTNPDRVRNVAELDALITEVLRSAPVARWTEVFDRFDVASDPVQNVEQVMNDPQTAALEQLEDVDGVLLPRLPLQFSETPAHLQGRPPQLGEHTRGILKEASYSDSEIDALLKSGVAGGRA